MTPRSRIALSLLLSMSALSACTQPSAQPKTAESEKSAKVEARFTPENPHFPGAGAVEETPEEVTIRTWWNALEGGDPQPVQSTGYASTALISLPFGGDQATSESLLPAGWQRSTGDLPPIYDPTLSGFTAVRYTLPEVRTGDSDAPPVQAEATLGFHDAHFGDLRLVFHELPDGGQGHAELLTTTFGETAIERLQEPDPAAQAHRKMITLTWRVVEEGKRSGFISYQVIFAGPTAGSAEALLQPGDKFVHASFTTMSPDMMTALRAANPVGSGTTP